MEQDKFLQLFKEQYIDGDEISLDFKINFRSISSFDSLTGMAIMAVIKDEFDVDLTIEEWKSLQTVEDVYNFIQIKLANR